jgi:uncharacterized repeat protein (TIGR01451 family)
VTIVSDPLNGAANAKAIPGAVLEYCLLLNNAGAQPATAIAIADTLPTQVNYLAGTMQTGGSCATATTAEDDDGSDGSDSDGFTASLSSGTLAGQVASLGAASTAAIRFRVEVR